MKKLSDWFENTLIVLGAVGGIAFAIFGTLLVLSLLVVFVLMVLQK